MLLDRPIPKVLFLEKSVGKDRFQILRSESRDSSPPP